MVGVVRHDNQENELRVLDRTSTSTNYRQNLLVIIVLDALSKTLE